MKKDEAYEIRKLNTEKGSSFISFYSKSDGGSFMWHYHEYFEMLITLKGEGKWLIGNKSGDFTSNQIYLIGPQLPHVFFKPFKVPTAKDEFHALVIMFSLSEDQLPEIKAVNSLLEKASQGLLFQGQEVKLIIKKLKKIDSTNTLRGLLCLLEGLIDLNEITGKEIATKGCILAPGIKKSNRLDSIYHYLHTHYKEDIKLSDIAKQACLSVSGLCAFFKRSSRQSVNTYIHELRISHACKFLLETDTPVTEIALAVGYKTISCFNRKFKDLQNCSPREYRNKANRQKTMT
jgi:AraC-like DNA-binding protein